ncbi:hypothetical protein CC80DRAFT_188450 [Byssothecium circinans]|uniref:Uncharacterized protein n=1 Tax=Byssothecium circinans TaxID=147558 RepID=A0A6A5TSF1_9PLEO|nr:hypothetical protein CC80DRAFT_188450 [Byssothecium circinans]
MSSKFGEPAPYSQGESASRKRRRYMSRSDEEILGEMDKKGTAYRKGWPSLPPLPVDTIEEGASVKDEKHHLNIVKNILDVQQMNDQEIFIAFRAPRNADENNLAHYLTLVCTTDTISNADRIQTAIVRIRNYLRQHECTEYLIIEIIDHRIIQGLVTYPIHHTEKSVLDLWPSISKLVFTSLNTQDWLSLQLLHRGIVEDISLCPPTVVITTPSASDDKWESLRQTILSKVRSVAPLWRIEVLFGTSIMAGRARYKPSNIVKSDAHNTKVHMGSSMSLEMESVKGCGTLGGFLKLKDRRTGDVKEYGLTNWHVVLDDRLKTIVRKTHHQGALLPGNKTLQSFPQGALSPGTLDHEGYIGDLQQSAQRWRSRLGSDPEAPKFISNLEKEISAAEKFERKVGVVYAGSGRRLVPAERLSTDIRTGKAKNTNAGKPVYNFIMDWALVQRNEGARECVNRLPEMVHRLGITSGLDSGQLCNRWSIFDNEVEDVKATKHGRTSKWTFGQINGALSFINPANDPQISDSYGLDSNLQAACIEVVPRHRDHRIMVMKGDSGSIFVDDTLGVWLGLLFGNSETDTAWIIPINHVLHDIEKVTGMEVLEPRYQDGRHLGLWKKD